MFRFFLKRLALTIPTFFALMFITFMLVRLVPGDPIEVRIGERGIGRAGVEKKEKDRRAHVPPGSRKRGVKHEDEKRARQHHPDPGNEKVGALKSEPQPIGYEPPDHDGLYHRIRVNVQPLPSQKIIVRTRPGYFAAARSTQTVP